MTSLVVGGGASLKGDISIQGSKNAALPILAACLLNRGVTRLNNCPRIADVDSMLMILEDIGCHIEKNGTCLLIDSSEADCRAISKEYAASMRSSIFLMGALMGRFHEMHVPYPGGCTIGRRPIDIHLDAFRRMNIQVEEAEDGLHGFSKEISGAALTLKYPSVGATENIIMAAVLAKGTTIIQNAAKEPEIIDLCLLLNKMGADIHGMGTKTVTVYGVQTLHDTQFTITADRIVAGTYLAAAAATCGNVQVFNVWEHDIKAILQVLAQMGCGIVVSNKRIRVIGPQVLFCADSIYTHPFPGFPTDMQSQLMACLCMARGRTTIYENVFEDRFKAAEEFAKMGADIAVDKNRAVITGVEALHGAQVTAHDLRGTAALVIAGLMAEGDTVINDSTYIKRGYEDICSDLRSLGAQIEERKTR